MVGNPYLELQSDLQSFEWWSLRTLFFYETLPPSSASTSLLFCPCGTTDRCTESDGHVLCKQLPKLLQQPQLWLQGEIHTHPHSRLPSLTPAACRDMQLMDLEVQRKDAEVYHRLESQYTHIHIHIIYIYTTYCTRMTSECYVKNSCMILIIRIILFWTREQYSCMSQSRLLGEGRAIPPHTYHVPTGPVVVPPSLRATRTWHL